MIFSEALRIPHGLTAIIGSGGKTTLLLRLAKELAQKGSVIVTTSTHIFPPEGIAFSEKAASFEGILCVGTPCENGKLSAPGQSFGELEGLADFVLVEADGSKHLPLKAHLPHEPVIPPNAKRTICVVGASGLSRPIERSVHRAERFLALTASSVATPEAVALALQKEALADGYFINQSDANEADGRELLHRLGHEAWLASLKKGEILCSF